MEKVIHLFNGFHFGDLHYSRGMVLDLLENGYKVIYHTYEGQYPFSDLDVFIDNNVPNNLHIPFFEYRGELWINTWVGSIELNANWINIKRLVQRAKETFNLPLNVGRLPEIKYENLPKLIKEPPKNSVFYSNTNPRSGQSRYIKHNIISESICDRHLILTNTNMGDYFGNPERDALLTPIISRYCNWIITLSSGPGVTVQVKETLERPDLNWIQIGFVPEDGIPMENLKGKYFFINSRNSDEYIKQRLLEIFHSNPL